ncbi:MAG TPA: hypothetical protein VMU50_11520 [Polyangia bacterium]|nr:hypothetical protein [Polyangia bacterium]
MKEPRNLPRPSAPAPRPEPLSDSESSDLVELQAIAASTRASATPAVVNPAELSGLIARRDSVVGARVTGAGPGMPPFVWGLIGCLGVLALGMGVFWYLGLPSSPAPATAEAPPAGPHPPAAPRPSAGAPQIVPLPARTEPAPPPAPEPVAPAHVEKEHAAHRGGKSAAHATTVAAADDAEAGEAPATSDRPGVPDRLLAAGAGRAAADPRRDVDAALDGLQPKVHECFRRFQIRGVAQVRLTVSPSGSVESPAVTGDFEGTPTGDCVLKEVASAALPPFKGGPVSVSHAYVFR